MSRWRGNDHDYLLHLRTCVLGRTKQWFSGMQKEVHVLEPLQLPSYGTKTQKQEGTCADIEMFLLENDRNFCKILSFFCFGLTYIHNYSQLLGSKGLERSLLWSQLSNVRKHKPLLESWLCRPYVSRFFLIRRVEYAVTPTSPLFCLGSSLRCVYDASTPNWNSSGVLEF